jgi:hypothetical protein
MVISSCADKLLNVTRKADHYFAIYRVNLLVPGRFVPRKRRFASGAPTGRSRWLPLLMRPPADYDALPLAGARGLQVAGFRRNAGRPPRKVRSLNTLFIINFFIAELLLRIKMRTSPPLSSLAFFHNHPHCCPCIPHQPENAEGCGCEDHYGKASLTPLEHHGPSAEQEDHKTERNEYF